MLQQAAAGVNRSFEIGAETPEVLIFEQKYPKEIRMDAKGREIRD